MAKRSVGIDIGSSGVRAAEVKISGKRVKLLKVAEVPLERGVVVGGEVRDPDALTAAVKQLWKKGRFSTKIVSIGLGGPQTLVRQVDLPWETPEVFRDSLPLRISNDLPVDPAEMTLDYHALEDFMSGQAHIQRSLVVASVNMVAEAFADALVKAGLKLKRADFSPFALIRAAVLTAGDGAPVPGRHLDGEEWPCEVVVDVGGQITTIAIHYRGRPLFIRVVTAGADGVTRALAENLQMSLDQAERVRRTLGISGVTDNYIDAIVDQLDPQQMQVAQYITNAMAGSLVQVVRESVEYFLGASPDISGVSRILISGGGALLPGYAERLSSELRAPASFLAPVAGLGRKFRKRAKSLDPRMTMAIGLALEVGKNG